MADFHKAARPASRRFPGLRRARRALFGLGAGIGLTLAPADPAAAVERALLIGVTDYAAGSGITNLEGPRNDVSALWRLLRGRGVEPGAITVLAQNLPAGAEYPTPAGAPTRAEILRQMDELAKSAKRGDTVIVYYSGHGTVQPDTDPAGESEPEPGGFDQVLLPADAGAFDAATKTVRNGIIDDEFGAAIEKIRAKGALVWAIVDACHSGSVTRAGNPDEVSRGVSPEALGIPEPSAERASATRGMPAERAGMVPPKPRPDGSGFGALVGFYAVDSWSLAIERPFSGYDAPMIGASGKEKMGVFTYFLHRAMTRDTAASFRDLAQEIIRDMSAGTVARAPVPVFDGDLDADIPGAKAISGPRRYLGLARDNAEIQIPAGSLHGFVVGSVVEVLDGDGPDAQVIGSVEITAATPTTSTAAWRLKQPPPKRPWIRLLASGVSFTYRVALPPAADMAEADRTRIATLVGDALKSGTPDAIAVETVAAGASDSDLTLRVEHGRIWLVRTGENFVRDPKAFGSALSVGLDDPKAAEWLRDAVWRLARASNLVRLAGTSASVGNASDVSVELVVQRETDPNLADRAACPKGAGLTRAAQPRVLVDAEPVTVGHCDIAGVRVTNNSAVNVAVAAFYVDARGGVSLVDPRSRERGCVWIVPAQTADPKPKNMRLSVWDASVDAPSTTGAENIVVVVTDLTDQVAPPQLCHLVQQAPQPAAMQVATRGGGVSPLRHLLDMAGAATGTTRGGAPVVDEEAVETTRMSLFSLNVTPRR